MSGCSEDLRVRATPKQSLKRVEIPLSQFRDVAVPYHIDLLKRHKVNIEKVRLCGRYVELLFHHTDQLELLPFFGIYSLQCTIICDRMQWNIIVIRN